MKTVILCGGLGTRIRNVADDIPKPMITVGGIPIIWHIMKYYAHFEYKDFVLCTGYKSNAIKNFFINYETSTRDFTLKMGGNKESSIEYHTNTDEYDWSVTIADTGLKSMTGARVKKIQKYIGDDEHFMLTYGDGLGEVDINKLVEFHKSHGKILTVTAVKPPSRFGKLTIGNDNSVQTFNEKPQTEGGLISGGYFVCRKEIFNYLNDDNGLVFEKYPLEQIVADNQMMAFEHDGFWQPMDTYGEYKLLNLLYNEGKAPWVKW